MDAVFKCDVCLWQKNEALARFTNAVQVTTTSRRLSGMTTEMSCHLLTFYNFTTVLLFFRFYVTRFLPFY